MWQTIHSSAQGRGHITSNTPCQDKTFSLTANNVSALALADGAGSAALSHFGAETAAAFICQTLCGSFDLFFNNPNGTEVKKALAADARKELERKAADLNCSVRDLASTLLAVAIKGDQFILLHIGDGVIGYLKNDTLKVASHPDNGEFTNSTVFLTSITAASEMRLVKGSLDGITGFALMSDGTAESLYCRRTKALSPALHRIMRLCTLLPIGEMQQQLETGLRVTLSAATADDCSLAVIARTDPSFQGYRRMRIDAKQALLHLKCKNYRGLRKQVQRYDALLEYLSREQTLSGTARFLHLPPRYTQKYLNHLLSLNLIKIQGRGYKTIVKL